MVQLKVVESISIYKISQKNYIYTVIPYNSLKCNTRRHFSIFEVAITKTMPVENTSNLSHLIMPVIEYIFLCKNIS